MATKTRWKATKTRNGSRNAGILWTALALAQWGLVLSGGSSWPRYVVAAGWALLAVFYLHSWRCWQPEWDER